MDDNTVTRSLIGVCVILFFIVIFLVQSIGSCDNELIIPGFWIVSEDFKNKANIDQLVFYFDEGNGYEYKGWMILTVDGETVVNEPKKFRITPKGYFKSDSFLFTMPRSNEFMPSTMTMKIDQINGRMDLVCLKDNKTYAQLYKDNQQSAQTVLKISNINEDPCADTDEDPCADTDEDPGTDTDENIIIE